MDNTSNSLEISRKVGRLPRHKPICCHQGTKAGAEKIVHATNSFIEGSDKHDYYFGGLDCRNAFNSCNRKMFMDNLKSEFPEIFPFFYSLYSGEGDLILWMDDGTNRTIRSSEGTLQGDPAGMFLFALGLKIPLQAIEQLAFSTRLLQLLPMTLD